MIYVRKFEPTQTGASLYKLTSKAFQVYLEDIRLNIDDGSFVAQKSSASVAQQPPQPPPLAPPSMAQAHMHAARLGLWESHGAAMRTGPRPDTEGAGRFRADVTYRLDLETKEALLLRIPRAIKQRC